LPNKILSVISGLSTFVILIALAILSIFTQILLLNGASEGQGFNAVSISLIIQSVGLLLAIIVARWLPNLLIAKVNLNKFLALIFTVSVATGLGAVISLVSIFVSIPLAGIK